MCQLDGETLDSTGDSESSDAEDDDEVAGIMFSTLRQRYPDLVEELNELKASLRGFPPVRCRSFGCSTASLHGNRTNSSPARTMKNSRCRPRSIMHVHAVS